MERAALHIETNPRTPTSLRSLSGSHFPRPAGGADTAVPRDPGLLIECPTGCQSWKPSDSAMRAAGLVVGADAGGVAGLR